MRELIVTAEAWELIAGGGVLDTPGKGLSTKHREPWITPEIEADLFAFIGGICGGHGGSLRAAGAADDHLHLLIMLPKTMTVADLMLHVKRDSSKWIKARDPSFAGFAWQEGYAAFSVGHTQAPEVAAYLASQREHHRRRSFKDELVAFLRKYEVEYDEQYIWT